MALKINMSKFNSVDKDSSLEHIDDAQEIVIEKEEAEEEIHDEPVVTETVEEIVVEEEPAVEKKGFEGANKDVLAEAPNLDEIPDIQLAVSEDESSLNEEQAQENLLRRESAKAYSMLEEELASELKATDIKAIKPIKVVTIGGSEPYYRTVLSQLRDKYPDVDFVKYINVGGKNAFYTIDSLNPDIIFMYYATSVQSALQFWDAVQNDVDDKGVPYAKKYANKRIIVLAPNDFKYEMELRSRGLNFYIMENNSRTHTVDVPQLMSLIHDAYNDIANPNARAQKQEIVQEVVQTQEEEIVIPQQVVSEARQVQQMYPTMPQMQTPQQGIQPHQIIGVYSASGGSGKTTFATNLAAILSKYGNIEGDNSYRVCLIEYNLVCQNIDLFFNFKTDLSVTKLAQEVSNNYTNASGVIEITPQRMIPIISRYIYKEPNTGLDILPGIQVPLEIDRLQKGFTNCLFAALRQMYDVVVVDMSADIAKTAVLEAFNHTDSFYYIMPMDVTSIRSTRVLVKFLTGIFKKSPESIKVILNKVNLQNEEFGVDQVYKALASDNCVPEGTIPDMARDTLSAINRGVPIVLEDPEHPVAQAIFSIAVGVNPMLNSGDIALATNPEKEESGGLFSKMFGGNKKKKESNDTPKKKEKSSGTMFKKEKEKKEKVEEPVPVPEPKFEEVPEEVEEKLPPKKKKKSKEDVPKEKKQGFFARLFGGGKKKKPKMDKMTDDPENNPPKLRKFPRD